MNTLLRFSTTAIGVALCLTLVALGQDSSAAGDQGSPEGLISEGEATDLNQGQSSTAGSLTAIEFSRLQTLDQKRIHEFTNTDFSDYLSLRSRSVAQPDVSYAIKFFAEKSLQQPYRLNAMRFDLGESDCISFVERVLAMALSQDWPTYYKLRQRLSHKDGVVSPLERNIFTEADWIPNNSWLWVDISEQLGPTKDYTCPIYRKKVLSARRFGLDNSPLGQEKAVARAAKLAFVPDEEMYSGKYLPARAIREAESRLRSGDVCLMIRGSSKSKHLFCDHVGILLRSDDGRIYFVHSAPPAVRKNELRRMFVTPRDMGIKILRLRDSARAIVATELSSQRGAVIQVATPEQEDERNQHFRDLRNQSH